jgi:hypothetical protein
MKRKRTTARYWPILNGNLAALILAVAALFRAFAELINSIR